VPEIPTLQAAGELAAALLRGCVESFPHVRLTVTGDCMRPTLRAGDVVRVVSAAVRPPRLGDVVLARRREGVCLHRLVWAPPLAPAAGPWRSKGDRAPRWDPPLAAADVLGVVDGVETPGRRRHRAGGRLGRSLLSLAGAALAGLRERLR